MATTDIGGVGPRPMRRLVALGVGALLVACGPQRATSTQEAPRSREHSLTIYGYNYTDTGIGSFEVDGHGGGNLEVSVPTAGGGKSTCCATARGSERVTGSVTIKWTRDGELWCTAEVQVDQSMPAKPEYLEVHFYRDGHIEVAITEAPSDPRLKLERASYGSRHTDRALNINNDNRFGVCQRGY